MKFMKRKINTEVNRYTRNRLNFALGLEAKQQESAPSRKTKEIKTNLEKRLDRQNIKGMEKTIKGRNNRSKLDFEK